MKETIEIEKYLSDLKENLLNNKKYNFELSRNWVESFTKEASVYIIREKDEICYVGETSNFQDRLKALKTPGKHPVKKRIAESLIGSKRDTTQEERKRALEQLIENHTFAFILVPLGRKELEEKIIKEEKPRYNTAGR